MFIAGIDQVVNQIKDFRSSNQRIKRMDVQIYALENQVREIRCEASHILQGLQSLNDCLRPTYVQ